MYIADSGQIRRADQIMIEEQGFPGILLMEAAGRRSAEYILTHSPASQPVCILAGPGNNGGDGLVIGRYLHRAGRDVRILCSHDPQAFRGDAGLARDGLNGSGLELKMATSEALDAQPDDCLWIDALLGTGVDRELRGPIADIIERLRSREPEVVAIDLPSGLNASTGAVLSEPLSARYTLTFQLSKLCHWITPAAEYCGHIVQIDIGIWPNILPTLGMRRQLITGKFVRESRQQKGTSAHKGSFGHALLVGGHRDMPGAIALSALAALQTGAGLSTAFIPGAAAAGFIEAPEVMRLHQGNDEFIGPERAEACINALQGKTALGIGPGMGRETESAEFLRRLLPQVNCPLILDADALNLLAEHADLWDLVPANSILTPHPGELQRLGPGLRVNENRLESAEAFARVRNVILVLKGWRSLVCLPDGRTFVNPTGSAALATAGSGDVLTGSITGLLAQGYAPETAACMGVWLHGAAGQIAEAKHGREGVTALRIGPELGRAFDFSEITDFELY